MSRRDDSSPPIFVSVLYFVSLGSWCFLFCGTGLGLILLLAALRTANGAMQEASLSAIFAALSIAAYVLTRCIEKVAQSVEKMFRCPPI